MQLTPIETRFFTFHSFKGGLGRSLALYNCACMLAGAGRRVLMIDLDLEAPGLTFFTQRQVEGEPGQVRPQGMVELILGFIDHPKTWPLAKDNSPEALFEFTAPLTIPGGVCSKEYEGELRLLPAGRIDDGFAVRLGRIRWDATPLAQLRERLFYHLRQLIIRTQRFDYVLVDARTGFSDEGYLSTRILADDIVALTGLNDQNILGTSRFLKQVDAWNEEEGRKRRVVLVESPVPEGEAELKEKRSVFFRSRVGKDIGFSLSLPYHPRLALYEEAMVAAAPFSALAGRYRELTDFLRQMAGDSAEHWTRRLRDALRMPIPGPTGESPAVDVGKLRTSLSALRAIDVRAFAQAASLVGASLRAAELPVDKATVSFLRTMAVWQPKDFRYPRLLALILRRLPGTNRDEIIQALNETVARARRAGEERDASVALYDLGRYLAVEGLYADAMQCYEQSIVIDARLGDTAGLGVLKHALALLHRVQGNYAKAQTGFEEALAIKQSLGDRRGIAITLHGLAELDHQRGDDAKARAGFEKAFAIYRSMNAQRGISTTLCGLADLDRLEGNYAKAREGFEKSIEIDRALGDRRGATETALYLRVTEALANNGEGVEQVVEAVRALEESGDRYAVVHGGLLLAEVYRAGREVTRALTVASRAADWAQQHGFRGFEADGQALRAVCLAEQGNADAARTAARSALDFFDEQQVRHPLRTELEAIAATAPAW